MVDQPCAEIQNCHEGGAPYRRACGHNLRIREEHECGHQGSGAAGDAAQEQQARHEPGEYRDVSARDRNDVVRARRLQPHPHVLGKAGAVSNQHCGGNGSRQPAVRRHPSFDAAPYVQT